MSQSVTMSIRLDQQLKTRLEKIAKATQRSKSYLASQAVREFIELNEWQIQEIKEAIKEADASEFATDGEVQEISAKWGINGD
ncbi:MAG: ribbon-helix-helix protein, CopG family [Gammaproteobacteria bacterium]|nr:ribbon-helix-helix protein, CopG family [Gammaproteobacteria bacterium]